MEKQTEKETAENNKELKQRAWRLSAVINFPQCLDNLL